LWVESAELDFGEVGLGISPLTASAAVTLTNRSTDPLTIDSVVVAGDVFTMSAGTPLVIPAGETLSVPVDFSPPRLGAYDGKLSFCAEGGIQLDVTLRGGAVQTPTGPNSHAFPPEASICITYGQPVDPATVDPFTFAVYGLQSGLFQGPITVNGGEICLTPAGVPDLANTAGVNAGSVSSATFRAGELLYTTATTRTLFLGGGGPDEPIVWQVQVATSGDGGGFVNNDQGLSGSAGDGVTLGDLDGDGDLDAYLWSEVAPNEVWLNSGTGAFSDSDQRLSDGVDLHTSDVALADLDGDGDLDAFVANYGFSNGRRYNSVWFNDGDGLFTNSGQKLGDAESRAVAIGDLDGDGDLDAFVANSDVIFISGYRPRNPVWLNDGDGTFTRGQSLGTFSSLEVKLGDVDRDGDLDVLVANNRSGQQNRLWLNKGDATFQSGQVFAESGSKAELGDLNGDGHLDALFDKTVWINDGQGLFSQGDKLELLANRRGALGDLDGDGDVDLYI